MTPSDTRQDPDESDAKPLRLLVVDDDEFDRRAVRRCLQQAGIAANVDEVESAVDALDSAQPGAYDLVLLDYHLPGVDTVQLLRRIREVSNDVPIVIFTGRGDEEIAVEFMKSGAVDYLPKSSLTPERLTTSIRYSLETARAASERRDVERSLREREAEFRTLANTIPQLAWIADVAGRRYWYNQRWHEFTGLAHDQSLGLGWRLVQHPEHRTRVCEGQLEAFSRGEAWEDMFPVRRRDGVYCWFLARAVPIQEDGGGITRWFGTYTDITAQKEGEIERERLLALEKVARADAERATRVRDEVLAIVAHDLRNSMHTIMASASMLAMTVEESSRHRFVGTIQRSTQEMERLVTDLLDVARIESGTFAVRRQDVDVRALIDEAIMLCEPQGMSRRVRLTRQVEADVETVLADRDRLIQVLSNLIGNGVKFTPADGDIAVSARRDADGIHFSVQDSGAGISPQDLPHIFDRFWQASRASRAGAGLGLAICKGIVDGHAGRIWVESAFGHGTTVHFTIPDKDIQPRNR